MASTFLNLLLLSLGMAAGTFICGSIPLHLRLSKAKLRVLEVLGAGLLIGASMTVVLPEGASAVFANKHKPQATVLHARAVDSWDWVAVGAAGARPIPRHDMGGSNESMSPQSTMGVALLTGFLLMFFIDQIASPGAHVHATRDRPHHTPSPARHRPPEAHRLRRSQSAAAFVDDSARSSTLYAESAGSSPEMLPRDYHTTGLSEGSHSADSTAPLVPRHVSFKGDDDNDGNDAAGSQIKTGEVARKRGLRQAFTSLAGLVIHAAADGIAMGASAGSKDQGLQLIVFLAIIIHKAPASFGLCTLLMSRGLRKADVRKGLLVFSLSTPFGAIATYLVLSFLLGSDNDGGSQGGIGQAEIGAALTFSAGTFLFVAMHAVQEMTSPEADAVCGEEEELGHGHGQGLGQGGARAGDAESAHRARDVETPPRQILGRTGRIALLLTGSVLPKLLQALISRAR